MAKNNTKPQIRFKGFTDAWEQRKLGDSFDMTVKNNTLSRADLSYDGGNVQSIHYGDVLIKYGAFVDSAEDAIPYIWNGRSEDYISHFLKEGDIIFADTAEDETVGKATEIADLRGKMVVSGLHTIVCRPYDRKAKYYLGYYFNSPSFHDQLVPLMQGIKVLSLSRNNLAKTDILYPSSKVEQTLIGKLFARIDNLITLHQRKRNRQDLLFSRKKLPLILAIAWEQRKLEDIVSVCSGKDYKHLNEGDIPVYGTGGYMLSVSEALSYFDDAIGIGRKGTIDKPYILKAPFWTVDTLFYAIPKEKTALDFVYCLFQIIDWKSKDESTGVPSLSKVAINSVDISIPKSEEQVRIGAVFFKIDNLITLHQRQVEKLKNIKSALLEKMFV